MSPKSCRRPSAWLEIYVGETPARLTEFDLVRSAGDGQSKLPVLLSERVPPGFSFHCRDQNAAASEPVIRALAGVESLRIEALHRGSREVMMKLLGLSVSGDRLRRAVELATALAADSSPATAYR
jgi:hypothetical protein